jgi:DNA polymerase-3 subunit delta'
VSAYRTRGQAVAVDSIRAMLGSGAPHAVLLVGPDGVGKTTLALDLAAALLCVGARGPERPCGTCRACRMVASGNHPDLHRLAPSGPGGQIRIGRRDDSEPGTIRRLTSDLSLMPVEGGARVAVIEHAERMNDDAQSALLKTLEEPPDGTTIVLCSVDEERLLETVRSRVARVRLAPVATREIEALLADRGSAEAPLAARLARISGGRPGVALGYAGAPEAVVARSEIGRSLVDLLEAGRAARLGAIGSLASRAGDHARALDPAPAAALTSVAADGPTARVPASERRRAALSLLEIWRDLARDLMVQALGHPERVRDTTLFDELAAASAGVDPADIAQFLGRLARAGELVEANVGPELVLDALVLGWPRRLAVA